MKNMDVLTEEQKEYIELKIAMNNMHKASKDICCLPARIKKTHVTTRIESRFYLFLECMEGKHNDFLQSIIDKTK